MIKTKVVILFTIVMLNKLKTMSRKKLNNFKIK